MRRPGGKNGGAGGKLTTECFMIEYQPAFVNRIVEY